MSSKGKLLILGLDPGTTLGYAILDIKGKLIKLSSSKNLSMNSLISKLLKEGKVVVVGTDIIKTPHYIEKVAARLGAIVISPKKDLLVKEKRKLTKQFNTKNRHEIAALAAALFAFKKIKNSFKKVDRYLKKRNKEEFSSLVKEKILKTKSSLEKIVDSFAKEI